MSVWTLEGKYRFSEGLVRYSVVGAGPDIVLVHGTPWSSFTWRRLIGVLSTKYKVHFYDFIGYGLSEKRDNQDVSLATQSQLLVELIAHWKLDSPKLIAHDFGGATSLRAHLLHGCEFDRLCLIDVVALAPWGSPFFSHIQKYQKAFAGVPAYIHKAIVEAYVRGALHQSIDAKDFAQLVQPWLGEPGQAAFYRQIAQADQKFTDEVEPFYAQIRCPVSILWGELDSWIPIETGERLHKAIPHSTFAVIRGAGHLAQLEAPGDVNKEVQKFLEI